MTKNESYSGIDYFRFIAALLIVAIHTSPLSSFSETGNFTVIIAPITSRIHTKAKLPTHTLIKDFDGLDKNSIILFEQIRTIDKQRLREYLGTLDRRFIHCADKALAISIGLAKKD